MGTLTAPRCAAVLLLALSTSAHAGSLYVGAAVGKTEYQDADEFAIGTQSTAFELNVGLRLQDALALEASYLNLGDVEDYYLNSQLNVSGVTLSAKALLPLGPQASLFAKMGLFSWEMDEIYQNQSYYLDEGTDLIYGGGLSLHLSRELDLNVEYRAVDVHDMSTSLITGGITYSF